MNIIMLVTVAWPKIDWSKVDWANVIGWAIIIILVLFAIYFVKDGGYPYDHDADGADLHKKDGKNP